MVPHRLFKLLHNDRLPQETADGGPMRHACLCKSHRLTQGVSTRSERCQPASVQVAFDSLALNLRNSSTRSPQFLHNFSVN